MNAEFNWWLLIVGLVIGAALVYLVLADSSRREADVLANEVPREATWIAAAMSAEGRAIDPPTAERVLELHRAYLAGPPPDPEEEEPPDAPERRAVLAAREPATRRPGAVPGAPVAPAGPVAPRAPRSNLRDEPHVERDAPQPEPAHRDVDQPR